MGSVCVDLIDCAHLISSFKLVLTPSNASTLLLFSLLCLFLIKAFHFRLWTFLMWFLTWLYFAWPSSLSFRCVIFLEFIFFTYVFPAELSLWYNHCIDVNLLNLLPICTSFLLRALLAYVRLLILFHFSKPATFPMTYFTHCSWIWPGY